MRSVLRATAILASSSVVSVLAGIASAKMLALMVGPTGLGLLGLMQSVIGIGGMVAGLGFGTAVIRLAARAVGEQDVGRAQVLSWAAQKATAVLGVVAVCVFALVREPFAEWFLGNSEFAHQVPLLGIAVALTLGTGIRTSVLNGFHRVGALARFGILNSVLGAGVAVAVVWIGGERGIVHAVLGTAVVGWLVSLWLMQTEVAPLTPRPDGVAIRKSLRALLGLGLPYMASGLFGAGVHLALPFLVLHMLDTSSVGFYRAAVAISTGYLGFLLSAMAQDYYPRIAAATGDLNQLSALLNQQIALVTLLLVPIILVAQVLTRFLVPLFYSPSFAPAAAILEWQLIGNLFKLWSWTMSFIVLARSRSSVYLATEVAGGVLIVVASWVGLRMFGLAGAGIGFLGAYVAYFALVWSVMSRDLHLSVSRQNLSLMLSALAASLLLLLLPRLGPPAVGLPVGLTIAVTMGVGSLALLWRRAQQQEPAPPL